MKNKILTVLLSVALAITITFATFSVYATGSINIGDTNGDGKIDLADVNHLAQYVAGWDVKLGEGATSSQPEQIGTKFDNANEANIWDDLPNKDDVNILMWRDYTPTEEKLIKDYEALTGVDIVTTVTTELEYPTKLVSMIFDNNAPDIVKFSANIFPSLIIKAMQPLDAETFYLDSDCWNKKYMDAYKINGKYYGVSMPGSWLCEDTNYVTYYSPSVLRSCGVTTMPYTLYQQGQWNWDTQNQIIRKAHASGLTGISMQSYDSFMHSAGVDFVAYNGSEYTNKLGSLTDSDLLSSSWIEVANLKVDNCLTGWALNDFKQNKVGLFTGIAYGLYNEGDWFSSSFAKELEAVPVAGPKGKAAYTPASPACWGVPKKASNAEGAAYFLRYFLDTSNYNHSSTFHTAQFESVFNIITSATDKKSFMYGRGVTDHVTVNTYDYICNSLISTNPKDITTKLNSKKNTVDTGVSRANKDFKNLQ